MKKIVLGVTGSIAAYKACELAAMLTRRHYQVHTIMTDAALEFVKPLTFWALTGNDVYRELFNQHKTHISLAREADLIVVAPASVVKSDSGTGTTDSATIALTDTITNVDPGAYRYEIAIARAGLVETIQRGTLTIPKRITAVTP